MPSSLSRGGPGRHGTWRACGQVYGQLALDSGLPGADAFVEGGGVRRLLWTGALVTLLYYSTSETLAILKEYFTYSVAVAFEYNTNTSFELPDVTVCNVNPLRRSKLCALNASEREMSSELEKRVCGEGQDIQETTSMLSSLSRGGPGRHGTWRACGQVYGQLALDSGLPGADAFVEGGGVRRLLWTGALVTLLYYSTSETLAILKEYFTYSVAVAFEYNTNTSFELPTSPCATSTRCANPDDLRLQQQISDWIAHHKTKNREWLRTLGHQFGGTFFDCTYHNQDCKDASLYRKIINVLYGNCFCFLCGHKERMEYSALSSPYDGLVITLNPELHEYLPTSYQAGFIVMVHAHGTRFSVCQDSVYLSPGYTTYVGLNLLAQTNLPEPYANPCRSTWPPGLFNQMDRMYGAYTRVDCLNICLQVKIVETCKCLAAQLPQLYTLAQRYGTCVEKMLECAEHVAAIQTSITLELECSCFHACTPPARLVLYFNSLTYEHVRSMPKYDETHVLGNLGGIIGMYLGLSFFVLFQVLDILVVGTLRLKKMLH
nr:acid-sensing ion channel 4-like [Rhipicephalus microplus]